MTLRVSLKFSDGNVVPVGVLSSVGRDTAFEYDASFLSLGLNPAPFRLPAKGGGTERMADAFGRRRRRESRS